MWRETPPGTERDRGQVFTLEGVFAALVIFISVLLALQAVTVVPGGGGSASSAGSENVAQSALSAMDDGTVRGAILNWPSNGFTCTQGTEYYSSPPDCDGAPYPDDIPPNKFGAVLSDQLGDGYQYNVVLRYGTGSGIQSQRMVYQGQPGAGAVRARTSVPLADDDEFRYINGTENGTRLTNGNLYASDVDSTIDIYNVIHVEVVAWQS